MRSGKEKVLIILVSILHFVLLPQLLWLIRSIWSLGNTWLNLNPPHSLFSCHLTPSFWPTSPSTTRWRKLSLPSKLQMENIIVFFHLEGLQIQMKQVHETIFQILSPSFVLCDNLFGAVSNKPIMPNKCFSALMETYFCWFELLFLFEPAICFPGIACLH
jgi:hypothetical protein